MSNKKSLAEYSREELEQLVGQLGMEKQIAETMVSEVTNNFLEAKREQIRITQYASGLEKSMEDLVQQLNDSEEKLIEDDEG